MNFSEIPNHVLHATPMTVGELKKKIRNLPNSTPIFMLLDKLSHEAWDEEKEQWRYVVPLVYVSRERIYSEEGDELNLILEYENP